MTSSSSAPTAPALSGLALRLVRDGILREDQATNIQKEARNKQRSFFTQLVREQGVDTMRLAEVASQEFGVPLLDLDAFDLDMTPREVVSEALIRKHQILPLRQRGSKLYVAVVDPTNARALEDLKFHTGLGVEPIVVDGAKLPNLIDDILEKATEKTLAELAGEDELEDIDITAGEEDDTAERAVASVEDIDTPIVRFVNKLLLDAIKRDASDIHIEPYEKKTRVRVRIDGVLHEVAAPPIAIVGRIVARVKILSKLDIAERRIPQDGRMKMTLSKNRAVDFRVSTLPTIFGEKIVIRILDSAGGVMDLEKLGFNAEQLALYMDAIQRPYGMILVTGPTGSGKTVSLYSALNVLNTGERNISSVEDPVEINLHGINQVTINEKANLNFSTVLRAFLRQDPDIIMVGEIRDLETADIAVKASQTGHLVLSTLHTNDAPSTLTRLLNMGVAPFNVASSVHLIMAQRLIRRLCPSCRRPVNVPAHALKVAGFAEEELDDLVIHGAVGCGLCTAGYKGRSGIFQVMSVTEEMGDMIMRGCTQLELEEQAMRQKVKTLRQAGLEKVKLGLTSLEEIERVTNI